MKQTRRAFVGTTAAIALAACNRESKKDNATASSGSSPVQTSANTKPIPRRKLGSTGVEVSAVGIGGYHIGIPDDESVAIQIVRSALDRGIDFLDNSWDYHDGKSEERMGKALRDGYRKKAFLMTKIDGRTKEAAAGQIDQSLKRLGTDVIDLLQIHEVIRMDDPDRVFAAGGAIEALLEAKKAGKIRFIGFTGHKDPAIHHHMLDLAKEKGFAFDTVQMPLNVMDAHFKSFEKEVLPIAVERKMGVLGMKPLGAGEILKAGVVSAAECLQYAMSLPTSVVITGCESMKDLEQAINVASNFQPLSAAEKGAILTRTAPHANGEREKYKTSDKHDSTAKHPQWLEQAKI
jgi:predicted aldo/keto reductase-like oxidoreductase